MRLETIKKFTMKKLFDQAVSLLEKLITTPSFSGEEDFAANHVGAF